MVRRCQFKGGVAYLRGDARRPARAIVAIGVGVPVDLAPETIQRIPGGRSGHPQQIIYNATDGMPCTPNFSCRPARGNHKACRPGLHARRIAAARCCSVCTNGLLQTIPTR